MTNLDTKNEAIQQAARNLVTAAQSEDSSVFEGAMIEFANTVQQSVIQEAKSLSNVTDSTILAQRGVRQLTGEETKYYQSVIDAMKSSTPKQSLENLDVVMPKTIIDSVFEDLTSNHELLNAIDFQNAGAVTEWLLNEHPRQLASWSPLCAEIVKELTSGFKKIDLQQNKLSAFIVVCKAMLDLGPVWLDRYVRVILSEALYFGLEDGILNGRGQTTDIHEPIGMRKNLEGAVVPATGYPDKEKTVLNSLDPASYGNILSKLSKTRKGTPRIVNSVILVVNPTDYLLKIMPATTPRATDGTYTHNVFPFPTTVIQSECLAEGDAIMGIGNRYLMAAGTGKSGRIEYSDEYRFLEDERVYLTKFYGHGQPKDNNSFLLLDISNLKPTVMQVEVTNSELPEV